jgi:hypothetical protein
MGKNGFKIYGLLILFFAIVFVATPVISGEKTETMKFVKSMEDERVQGVGICNKIIVQDKNGNRWFVWYYYKLGISEGDKVLITFDGNEWKKISNLENGKEEKVRKVLKIAD